MNCVGLSIEAFGDILCENVFVLVRTRKASKNSGGQLN